MTFLFKKVYNLTVFIFGNITIIKIITMCNAHSRVIKCQTMLNTFSEKYNCHSSNLYFPNILILFAKLFLRSCWKESVFYFTELNHCILKTIHWNRFLWIWHLVDDSSSFVNLSCSFKEDIQIKDTNVASMYNVHCTCIYGL